MIFARVSLCRSGELNHIPSHLKWMRRWCTSVARFLRLPCGFLESWRFNNIIWFMFLIIQWEGSSVDLVLSHFPSNFSWIIQLIASLHSNNVTIESCLNQTPQVAASLLDIRFTPWSWQLGYFCGKLDTDSLVLTWLKLVHEAAVVYSDRITQPKRSSTFSCSCGCSVDPAYNGCSRIYLF